MHFTLHAFSITTTLHYKRSIRPKRGMHCQRIVPPVKRRFRVRDNSRFREIRRLGEAYSDRLLVVCTLHNQLPYSRFGFSVSKRIGNAVVRNRVKRRLREAVRIRMDTIRPGWDLVFIARQPIRDADFHQIDAACVRLLARAGLIDTQKRGGYAGENENKPGARNDTGRQQERARQSPALNASVPRPTVGTKENLGE